MKEFIDRYENLTQAVDVIDFIQVERIMGEVLGSMIVEWLTSHNLLIWHVWSMVRGNMSGARSGCKTLLFSSLHL